MCDVREELNMTIDEVLPVEEDGKLFWRVRIVWGPNYEFSSGVYIEREV